MSCAWRASSGRFDPVARGVYCPSAARRDAPTKITAFRASWSRSYPFCADVNGQCLVACACLRTLLGFCARPHCASSSQLPLLGWGPGGMNRADVHEQSRPLVSVRPEAAHDRSERPAMGRYGVWRPSALALLVTAATMMAGGGGTPAPISEMIAQLVALAGIAIHLLLGTSDGDLCQPSLTRDRPLFALLALWLALPLVQLVPLPAAMWQALPAREALFAALQSVDAASGWWPISLTPYRTIAAFLSLVPMVVVILIAVALPLRQRSHLLFAIVAVAAISALLGIVQVSSGGPWLYARRQGDFAVGLIANRNAHADFLLIALLAVTTLAKIHAARLRAPLSRVLLGALGLYFVLSVVLTGSRTGMALLSVPFLHAVWLFRSSLLSKNAWRTLLAIPLAGALAVVGLLMTDGGNLQRSLDRFGQTSDGRLTDIWPDALYAAQQSWPIGTGMGSFVPVFESVEQLEVVDETNPNRAHSDYLEITMEAGAVGIVLVLATLAAFAWRCRTIMVHDSGLQKVLASFALGTGLILATHSLVDYPLRTITLSAAMAVAVALLFRPRSPAAESMYKTRE